LMERETGIEPATSSLGSWRSTAELLPLRLANNALNDVSLPPLPVPHNRITSQGVFFHKPLGRPSQTRHPHLL
jgi:hypothetical protein